LSLLDRPFAEQAAALAAGEADGPELLDETLARIAERNEAVNAVVETFPEHSRKMLDAAPEGPMRGVPVVIKDEWPLPWRAERFGAAEMFTPTAPGESGPYRALRDAGAVIVGVANMHEWGSSSTGNASVYGPAHNPWNLERCPGGSSSGPAAAVGSRIVGGAVGADGIGSIRYPAAYCGLTGLKPTFGRSAMQGHHMRGTTMIVSGPLCSDAAGCRLLGSALYGEQLPGGDASGLRIGVVRGPIAEDCAPQVVSACENAIEALGDETGGTVKEVEIPGLELSGLAAVLIGGSGRAGRHLALEAQFDEQGDRPDQPRPGQVPDADARVGAREGGGDPHHDAALSGRCVRRRRRDRLAERAGSRAATGGAAGRASLRHSHRRCRQPARRRARQPDRHPCG